MAQPEEIVSFPATHLNIPGHSGRLESLDLTDSDEVRRLLEQIGIASAPHFVRLEARERPDAVPSSLDGVHFRVEGNITDEVRERLRRLGAEFTSITHETYPS